jgi:hypothetical protein
MRKSPKRANWPDYISLVEMIDYESGIFGCNRVSDHIFLGRIDYVMSCPFCDLLDCYNTIRKKVEMFGGKVQVSEEEYFRNDLEWSCSTYVYFKWSSRPGVPVVCKRGHKYTFWYGNIDSGDSGCEECGWSEGYLEGPRQYALDHGGKCLSEQSYKRNDFLKWECSKGHVWKEQFLSFKRSGCWCPECRREDRVSKRTAKVTTQNGFSIDIENKIRYILEDMFSAPFIKSRPLWLYRKKTDRFLELDGYCSKHNVAFELNGRMHYDKSQNPNFKDQVERDQLKRELCDKHGVRLLVINFKDLLERNGWNEDLWRLDIRDMLQSQFDVGII